jgi:hypothetical protein
LAIRSPASRRFSKSSKPQAYLFQLAANTHASRWPALARSGQAWPHQRSKGSVLVPFAERGRSSQVQNPHVFNDALIDELARRS